MMRKLSLITILILLTGLLIVPVYMEPTKPDPLGPISGWPTSEDIAGGEFIVGLRLGASIAPDGLPGIRDARSIEKQSRVLLRVALSDSDAAGKTVIRANQIKRLRGVATVDLNYLVHAAGAPNDPRYNQEWHLPAVHADQAWDLETGEPTTIIAVIDTGADYSHPDLSPKLLPGYDFANRDDDATDDQGHGTHVAGIAAAATDNGEGVAGTCWGCSILPVKALDENGQGGHAQIASAIVWAVDHGAKVINLSLGGPYTSATLQGAIDYAWSNGVLIVAAAGNAGSTRPAYPAAYDRVMAVAATNQGGRRAMWSNYGSWISLAAPGATIWSTTRGATYQAWSGTSMAAPIVAGAAGILVSRFPTWTNLELRQALENTATPLSEAGLGTGLVDVHAALTAHLPSPEPDDATPTATEAPTREPTPTPETTDTQALVDLINQARTRRSLRPVSVDSRLAQAAQSHSEDMAANSFCDHAGSDGSSPYQRMLAAGYPSPLYEIVGCSYGSAQSLFDAIMATATVPGGDPSPRDRILAPEATAIGVGYSYGGGWKRMWTIDLGGDESLITPTTTAAPPPTATAAPLPTATKEPGYCLRCEDRAGLDSCTEIECPTD